MEASLKKILKSVTLELRHLLEGRYDSAGVWQPGDLENRLASIGVRGDRNPRPADELQLTTEDQHARKVVDAYLKLREEAGVPRAEAVAEFLRETAYTWANRLIALRCMESRDLIDSVILQQEAYGGRSLEHHRLAQRQPELCAGEDDGLFGVLDKVFREQAERLPMLFDPQSPGVVLRPSPAAIKDCFGLLSLNSDSLRKYRIRIKEDENADADTEPPNPFVAPDALGWTYQYWNTEEKDRVFEKVRTVKGAKISGADIVPATQLYTEDYMVKFLVQNSLGATWMGLHPESRLCGGWEYYVRDADRAPVTGSKPVREITFLDPACGSGHFLLEAFDLFYAMYEEEGELSEPAEICNAILTQNLFGIDIDARAVQIAEAALWMKAAERAFDYSGAATNLVAATASHLKGIAWEEFLSGFEREPSVARVLRKFAQSMEHVEEIGSLARPAEDLREIIREEHAIWERQIKAQKEANYLFPEMTEEALSGQLPFHEISDEEFGERLFYRVKAGIDGFTRAARDAGEFEDQMLGNETRSGFRLVDLLSKRYDVVAANPPYMGAKDMGTLLKAFLTDNYGVAKYDLYAAFITRCQSLVSETGVAALVTMQSFLYTNRFSGLREHLLQTQHLILGLHLGGFAFAELGDHVFAICTLWQAKQGEHDREMTVLDVSDCEDKEASVVEKRWKRFRLRENKLRAIEGTPFLYDLPVPFFDLFESQPTLAHNNDIVIREGIHSNPDERFRRMHWEVAQPSSRWYFLAVGGACQKWAGLDDEMVEYADHGIRLRQMPSPIIPSADLYGRQGISYSDAGASGFIFTCREILRNTFFSSTGPAIISRSDANLASLMAFLNSTFASFLLDALNPGTHFKINDVKRVPVPAKVMTHPSLSKLARTAIEQKLQLLARDPTSRYFTDCAVAPSNLCDGIRESWIRDFDIHERIVLLEAEIDSIAADLMGLSEEAVDHVRKLYRPSFSESNSTSVRPCIEPGDIATYTPQNVRYSKGEKKTYAEYPCQVVSLMTGCSVTVSTDCLREAIGKDHMSAHLGVGVVSNLVTQYILSLLGHRWPAQVEAGTRVPDWADKDGILPLTPVASEPTLYDRIQERFLAEQIESSQFDEVVGKTLEAWLAADFFKYHTKQFKKRPIAWQLQSGKFTARKAPAFACLIYYHKLDADTLPKIRSQYVGPIRQRMETELRGIESVAVEARSDRQEKRRLELADAIKELTEFDGKLEQVIRTGFATRDLTKLLTDEPLDRWCSLDGARPRPATIEEFVAQEGSYAPDINDGVRVNIAPLQKAGLLAADVLAKKDVEKAIADRAQWRSDERRWVREGKLPQPGWWPEAQP